jgi:hypothetical protein
VGGWRGGVGVAEAVVGVGGGVGVAEAVVSVRLYFFLLMCRMILQIYGIGSLILIQVTQCVVHTSF